jgi:hypothetical protein
MKPLFAAVLFIATLSLSSISVLAQSKSREDLLKEIETKRTELSALEKKFLAPSEEDRAAYADFLQQPDTGLIRLLPRDVYESEAYKKNKKTLTMRGGGAYYSFSRLTHEYGYGSDLELDSEYLSVGFAGADYGMMVKLGDQPLEELTIESPSVRFISEYNAPRAETQARDEYRRFAVGTTTDGLIYKTRLPVEARTTYLLRSINYSSSDVLVAFRVVRKDTDRSVIIAWKLLKKYPSPELARSKTEQ